MYRTLLTNLTLTLFVIFLCLLSVGCWSEKIKPNMHVEPVAPPLIVSLEGEGTFKKLSEALHAAKPGNRILIRDEVLHEAVYVRSYSWTPPITVTSESGQVVKLLPPKDMKNAPAALLTIEGITGLQMKGFVLDAQDKIDDGVRCMGLNPDLKLEDFTIENCKKHPLYLISCSGTEARKASFVNVRTSTQQPKETPALYLHFMPNIRNSFGSEHLVFKDCQFRGPYKQAVVNKGPVGALQWSNVVHIKANGVEEPIAEPVQ